MQNELTALASDPKVSALLGALGVMVLKEIVGRFFRRSEHLETKWEERQEGFIAKLTTEIEGVRHAFEGMRHALELMGERLATNKASIVETRDRVDEHGNRISALEAGQAELRAHVGHLSSTTGGKDD